MWVATYLKSGTTLSSDNSKLTVAARGYRESTLVPSAFGLSRLRSRRLPRERAAAIDRAASL